MFYINVERWKKCLISTFLIFILIRVTHKSNPDGGMEAMGDGKRPHGFFVFIAIGATLWLFYF
jgi:hypothetical protein